MSAKINWLDLVSIAPLDALVRYLEWHDKRAPVVIPERVMNELFNRGLIDGNDAITDKGRAALSAAKE